MPLALLINMKSAGAFDDQWRSMCGWYKRGKHGVTHIMLYDQPPPMKVSMKKAPKAAPAKKAPKKKAMKKAMKCKKAK